jgi:hypothetical protein
LELVKFNPVTVTVVPAIPLAGVMPMISGTVLAISSTLTVTDAGLLVPPGPEQVTV